MSDDEMTPLEQEVFDTFILGFGMTTREADAIQAFVESALARHDAEAWEQGAVFALRDQGHTVDVFVRDVLASKNPHRKEATE